MQNYTEVVYLKNGSIIKGIIIEQIPNQSLKIQTADGSIFFYQMYEVEKIAKEEILSTPVSNTKTRQVRMKRGGRDLWLDGRELSDNQVKLLVDELNYITYCEARRQLGWGNFFAILFWISLGWTIFGSLILTITDKPQAEVLDLKYVSIIAFVVANISLILMIILKSAGKGRINWVANNFNKNNS